MTSSPLSEGDVARLVPAFYDSVRRDPVLGPVFDGAVDDWDSHLEKLVDFWSSVMLGSGRYKGNPLGMHMKHLPEITPHMFDRWLALWAEVTEELLPKASAGALQEKAARIAESLKLGLFFRLTPVTGSPSPAAQTAR